MFAFHMIRRSTFWLALGIETPDLCHRAKTGSSFMVFCLDYSHIFVPSYIARYLQNAPIQKVLSLFRRVLPLAIALNHLHLMSGIFCMSPGYVTS